MTTDMRRRRTDQIGYQCWFCAKRYARPGESPSVWRETFCATMTDTECEVEDEFWTYRSRKRSAK